MNLSMLMSLRMISNAQRIDIDVWNARHGISLDYCRLVVQQQHVLRLVDFGKQKRSTLQQRSKGDHHFSDT